MKVLQVVTLFISLLVLAMSAQADSILGSADAFGILGASAVTNTGPSVVYQDLGVWPGNSITGFPPGVVLGSIHNSDAVAMQAQADALAGYNYLTGLSSTQNLTGQDLGGLTLDSGVYSFASSAQMTGTLNLDFQGQSNKMIVFQIGSTLTTASASKVNLLNLGMNDQVFWQVGSSATLGTTTDFFGSIIAEQSITMNTGADISCGRAIALNGAVTMDTNSIDTGGACGSVSVPEPATLSLVGSGIVAAGATAWPSSFPAMGLAGLAGLRRRMRRPRKPEAGS